MVVAALPAGAVVAQVTVWDVAFLLFVIGLLVTMTGALGDPNLLLVGLVVSIAGVIGMLLGPYSTPLVLGALIPIVGFVVFYVYRFVRFPLSERPDQTSSARSLVGEGGFVTERVTPRDGAIKLDGGGFDPHYRCRTEGGTIEVGERAVVVAPGGGNVLTVAPEGSVDPDDLPRAEDTEVGWKVVNDLRDAIRRYVGGGPNG